MTSIISKSPPTVVHEMHKDAARLKSTHLKDLLSDDERNSQMFKEHQGVIVDFCRQKIDMSTFSKLVQVCNDMNLPQKIERMFSGELINETENRSVLHTALRAPANEKIEIEGKNIVAEVHAVLTRIKKFAQQIRSGELLGHTGKVLKDVVCVGIGGSFLGTDFVHQALKSDPVGKEKSKDRQLRFCANVDPVDVDRATEGLFPETTLVIVVSKTFTTAETMLNARTLKNWLSNGLKSDSGISKHLAAVSTNLSATSEFGISADRVFGFWDWVGGRFSVCSAVGMLPLAVQYGGGVVQNFLDGCHMMDNHFRTTPPNENIPILMGMLSVWNSSFLGFGDVAILPYAQALHKFPAHIQQLTMESNGKRVAMNGEELTQPAGEVFFGDAGTNAQHSFYQLMHQGRTIPAEFIGFCKSQFPVNLPDEPVSNHDELMSNYFAQCDALAYGKSSAQCLAEGVSANLVSHKTFPGDRPSVLLLMPECNAYYVGCLLSIYEHRTAVEGFLWGVNSFDQWGVELGKVLAKQVRSYFNKQRKNLPGAADALEVLPKPTQRLIQLYVEANP